MSTFNIKFLCTFFFIHLSIIFSNCEPQFLPPNTNINSTSTSPPSTPSSTTFEKVTKPEIAPKGSIYYNSAEEGDEYEEDRSLSDTDSEHNPDRFLMPRTNYPSVMESSMNDKSETDYKNYDDYYQNDQMKLQEDYQTAAGQDSGFQKQYQPSSYQQQYLPFTQSQSEEYPSYTQSDSGSNYADYYNTESSNSKNNRSPFPTGTANHFYPHHNMRPVYANLYWRKIVYPNLINGKQLQSQSVPQAVPQAVPQTPSQAPSYHYPSYSPYSSMPNSMYSSSNLSPMFYTGYPNQHQFRKFMRHQDGTKRRIDRKDQENRYAKFEKYINENFYNHPDIRRMNQLKKKGSKVMRVNQINHADMNRRHQSIKGSDQYDQFYPIPIPITKASTKSMSYSSQSRPLYPLQQSVLYPAAFKRRRKYFNKQPYFKSSASNQKRNSYIRSKSID